MTSPKWLRPDHPANTHTVMRHNGHNWSVWSLARLAIADAEHAGDPLMAARVLRECADRIVVTSDVWTRVRPPLGRHVPGFGNPRMENAA